MFCTKCGNEIEDKALFCTTCGAKVVNNDLEHKQSQPLANQQSNSSQYSQQSNQGTEQSSFMQVNSLAGSTNSSFNEQGNQPNISTTNKEDNDNFFEIRRCLNLRTIILHKLIFFLFIEFIAIEVFGIYVAMTSTTTNLENIFNGISGAFLYFLVPFVSGSWITTILAVGVGVAQNIVNFGGQGIVGFLLFVSMVVLFVTFLMAWSFKLNHRKLTSRVKAIVTSIISLINSLLCVFALIPISTGSSGILGQLADFLNVKMLGTYIIFAWLGVFIGISLKLIVLLMSLWEQKKFSDIKSKVSNPSEIAK